MNLGLVLVWIALGLLIAALIYLLFATGKRRVEYSNTVPDDAETVRDNFAEWGVDNGYLVASTAHGVVLRRTKTPLLAIVFAVLWFPLGLLLLLVKDRSELDVQTVRLPDGSTSYTLSGTIPHDEMVSLTKP